MSSTIDTTRETSNSPTLPIPPSIRRHRKLVVEQQERRVILNGSVPSYYDKQMVQELIRRLDGIEEVINQLIVTGEFEDA